MAERARIAQLRETMSRLELDAFLVSQPENRLYMSGYSGHDQPPLDSAGYLLITASEAFLLTDGRTTEQAQNEAKYYEVRRIETKLSSLLAQLVPELRLAKIGFEGNHLTYRQYQELKEALGTAVDLVPSYDVIDSVRALKGPAELEAIRDAVVLADAAFAHVLNVATVGMTEKQLAWEMEAFLRKNGSEGVAFDTIVAAGPNGSMAHHSPGDRPIQAGEPVIIDWGARVGGYCSDITRTIVLGEPDARFRELYPIVLEAQVRAEQRIEAGMTGSKADALARKVITNAGHGESFSHSLGHGIGIAVHEKPRLGTNSEDILENGMVFSVEPGIYIPGWGGIRIEDLVVLRGGKPIVLTRSPKQLEAMEV